MPETTTHTFIIDFITRGGVPRCVVADTFEDTGAGGWLIVTHDADHLEFVIDHSQLVLCERRVYGGLG